MKKFLLLLSLLAVFSSVAAAQNTPTVPSVRTEQVNYSPSIPATLRRFLPKGGKTRFWGVSNLTYRGRKVWMHVYDVHKTRFLKDETNLNGEQDSGLDLFLVSGARRLQKLSSTRFTYGRYGGYDRGGDYESVGVQTLWLDPQAKRKTIVQIAFQNPDGLYGTITKFMFATFNRGLDQAAVTRRGFGQGSSNAADWSSWSTRFEVGDSGLTEIIFHEGSMPNHRDTIFKWINGKFRSVERRTTENLYGDSPPDKKPKEKVVAVSEPLDDPANFDVPRPR